MAEMLAGEIPYCKRDPRYETEYIGNKFRSSCQKQIG